MLKSYPLAMQGVEFRGHGVTGIYEMGERIAFVHFAFAAPSEQNTLSKLTPGYVLLDTFSRDFSEHKRSVLAYEQREIFSAASALCYLQDGHFVLNTRYYEGFVDSPAKLIKIQDGEMSELGDAPAPVKQIYNDVRTYEFDGFAVRMSSPFMMECRASQGGSNLNGAAADLGSTLNSSGAAGENLKNFSENSGAAAVCKASKNDPRDETSEAKDKISNGGKPTRKKAAAKGKTLWRLKLGAYLYTPVCLRGGATSHFSEQDKRYGRETLYFGTAGKGGHLYAVDATSGEVIFKLDTGGTERFAWCEDKILLADRRGKPVLISAEDGSILKEVEFGEFQFGSDQIMLVSGGRLYAVANDGAAMYAVCADI
ncbi:PQQ-binding-like beta-propeller repeat protein [uncultured Campylobacter sp.]|uniref:outer membrane protein assembly factor BamB family protein n=1 Tax=uncultured Campylobacter sp. TaxID=218934 RepID=UPI002622502C|nr:PQQ-binding-like beta-propeller repeat protein [uncultured Campylobacter sp.]